jgi:hypothetical protein
LFDKLFDVFSKREMSKDEFELTHVPVEFRNRLLMLLRDQLHSVFTEFLYELQEKVAYLYGRFELTPNGMDAGKDKDLLSFILNCKEEELFDVLELIFKSNLPGITYPDNALIPSINKFFNVDNLPYHLTDYSMEESEVMFNGLKTIGTRISEYPIIIRKDSNIVHRSAIEPTLILLKGKNFVNANKEFLGALEDHRKGEYGDCLAKCGSSFESVMKILCKENSISYKETDTASRLLKALLSNSSLDSFWEQPLILIATVRNKLSTAHGAGTSSKIVTDGIATYSVNATASAILFLATEFS